PPRRVRRGAPCGGPRGRAERLGPRGPGVWRRLGDRARDGSGLRGRRERVPDPAGRVRHRWRGHRGGAMTLSVQKFGGTSAAGAERVRHVATRILASRKQGHDLVVVVSAPGDMTDELIGMARQITEDPPARELDMLLATGEQVSIALLAMALHRQG